MKSKYTDKFTQGAAPYLADGEEVLAAFIAQPKGRTQAVTGAGTSRIASELGHRKQRAAHEAAGDAGLVLEAPMALCVTNQRLMTLKISAPVLGRGGEVKDLLSAVPLASVDTFDVKRVGLAKRIKIAVQGTVVELEAAQGAHEAAEAFAQAKAS